LHRPTPAPASRLGILHASPARRFLLHSLLLLSLALLVALGAQSAQAQAPDDGVVQESSFVFLPIAGRMPLPYAPRPSLRESEVNVNSWLSWAFDPAGLAPEHATNITYDLLLDAGDGQPSTVVARGLTRPLFGLGGLEIETNYVWQVMVHTGGGITIAGPTWRFTTNTWEVVDSDAELAAMVDVPEGPFFMGCDNSNNGGYGCRDREVPARTVWLSGFRIDKYEVTNRQYRTCVAAGGCQLPRLFHTVSRDSYYDNPEFDYYPVLWVSWWDAYNYCKWAGKRLPSEAEWEKAARGFADDRPWPWGQERISCERANFTNAQTNPHSVCTGDTQRVGSYPLGASPYGAMDMAGNAFEWVMDWWNPDWYDVMPLVNPVNSPGYTDPSMRPAPLFVIRGGSYRPDWYYPRTFNRHWGHHGEEHPSNDHPYYRNDQVSFRCAQSLP
jgi:formylglycine-generating enzyme required for sulfatase activity